MTDEKRADGGFSVGTTVRVKPGTPSDYPDIPMGGWVGVIREIDRELCLLEFDKRTLDQVHPIYHKCAKGMGFCTIRFGFPWMPST
jgi:hypothetical protein